MGILFLFYSVCAFICSFGISFLCAPLFKLTAIKIGAVDIPDCERKLQKAPICRLGGLGILFAFFVSGFFFSYPSSEILYFMIPCFSIVAVGIVDDARQLGYKIKLFWQIIIACLSYFLGFRIEAFFILTIFFVIFICNSYNFIDGADGLLASQSIAFLVACSGFFIFEGEYEYFVISTVLCGAVAGFYPYNRFPAKIFSGDCGSQFLGLACALLAVKLISKINCVCVMLLLIYPICDVFFAVFSRAMKKKSIFSCDREHIHYALLSILKNQRTLFEVVNTINILFASLSFLIYIIILYR